MGKLSELQVCLIVLVVCITPVAFTAAHLMHVNNEIMEMTCEEFKESRHYPVSIYGASSNKNVKCIDKTLIDTIEELRREIAELK